MNPRSLTPEWRMPRSSRRSTAWRKVALESANATWCTQPGSVGVRSGEPVRSSLVKIVIRRPSPGSKYRCDSAALSRLGCSKMNGIPSTPSQKSIDVCRSAPTIVMWWTPWVWSLRIAARPRSACRCCLGLAQPAGELLEQRPRDVRVIADEGPEVPRGHARAAQAAVGGDRRGAAVALEQRQLAEVVAGLQRAPLLAADRDARAAFEDHEEPDPRLALGDDLLAVLEALLVHRLRESPHLLV